MDKSDRVDDNLNQLVKNNEALDNSYVVIISESELEKHLNLLDIILEMEMVIKTNFIIKITAFGPITITITTLLTTLIINIKISKFILYF